MTVRSIFLCNNRNEIDRVYDSRAKEILKTEANIDCNTYCKEDIVSSKGKFDDVDFIFSTWGMPFFTEDEITDYLPALKCVFYSAGTVQYFARPFLEKGIKVFSAWSANAVPVAEFTVSLILLASKGFLPLCSRMSRGDVSGARKHCVGFPGNYGETIGIIGAGKIGRLVIDSLHLHELKIAVFDPFLPDSAAKELGVIKCTLPELFEKSFIISNHLANNAQTKGMLDYDLFSKMRENATFINTGRGAQVVEDDLVRILSERPDITAILDVTDPEPPHDGHPFFGLDNCYLTPHIAGSSGDEVHRMPYCMIDQFRKYISGEKCEYEVTVDMLATMA